MHADIKSRWVSALRSGQYAQGRHALCETVGEEAMYCCLGVLCEIALAEGVVKVRDESGGEDDTVTQRLYDDSPAYLPESVRHWAGLDSANGYLPGFDGGYASLSGLNDSGRTFSEIADVIENNF